MWENSFWPFSRNRLLRLSNKCSIMKAKGVTPMGTRHILHCDMNCFYASVEMQRHPELRDTPLAVCGSQEAGAFSSVHG